MNQNDQLFELYQWKKRVFSWIEDFKDADIVIPDVPRYMILIPKGDKVFKQQANSIIEEVNQALEENGFTHRHDTI